MKESLVGKRFRFIKNGSAFNHVCKVMCQYKDSDGDLWVDLFDETENKSYRQYFAKHFTKEHVWQREYVLGPTKSLKAHKISGYDKV